jgi:uncharacterized protein (DUF2336 family)
MSDEASYEEAKRLARDSNLKVRRDLARRTDVQPEILYYLAEDQAAEVRRAIAANEATPHQADQLLLRDTDEQVRAELAQKVARLLPGLPEDAQTQARERVIGMLEVLARDEAVRVRQAISEAVKGRTDISPEIVGRLARDVELAVAGPVLRLSALLTDEDLLDIIAGTPPSGALSAIAGRARVGAGVSDAIVAADDEPAIAALLANPSAQIREETLDLIVDRAPQRKSWHEPLVRRPALPVRAATRIARFVADSLLDVLKNRKDLPASTRAQIAVAVTKRLADETKAAAAEPAKGGGEDDTGETVEDKVRRLKKEGKLDEDAVSDAVDAGQRAFVRAALAVLAEVPISAVDKILSSRSAKGVVALAWKAGLSVRLAGQLQTRIGGISPRQALHSRGGKDYPLTVEEMTWQIEFFGG